MSGWSPPGTSDAEHPPLLAARAAESLGRHRGLPALEWFHTAPGLTVHIDWSGVCSIFIFLEGSSQDQINQIGVQVL